MSLVTNGHGVVACETSQKWMQQLLDDEPSTF